MRRSFVLVFLLHCSSASEGAPLPAPARPTTETPPPAATAAAAPQPTPPPPPPGQACAPTDPRATPVVVSVLPDAGEQPYVDLLATAKSSIKVMGYMMGYGAILDTLTAKARGGVDVKVIL